MKTIRIPKTTWLCVTLLAFVHASQAGNVFKADNANNLNDPAAWSGVATPTLADIAVWNNTVQANNTSSLGADTNWAGIKILDPALPITINAGNVLILGASGIDMSLATNSLTLANAVSNSVSQTWNVASGQTLAVSGVLSGPSTNLLTKIGNGVLALSAANTYSGGTVVNGGVLQIGTGAVGTGGGTGAITNNNGTTLRINTTATMANAMNFNGTVTIDLNNVGGNQGIGSPGAISGPGNVTFINQNTAAVRTFTLGGSGSSMANFTGSISIGTNTGTFRFNDGGGSGNTGSASASFDLGTSNATFFTRNRGAAVNFGELTGGSATRITTGSSASGTSVYSIGAKNTSTTFNGTITDGGTAATGVAITKVGTGTLTLTSTNNNIGVTTITLGALQIGNGGTSGQLGSGAVVNNANLIFNRSDAFTNANAISGSGNVIQFGGNVLTYSGTNSSSGTLIVSNGTVALDVAGLILCPIRVLAGATLDVSQNPTFTLNQNLSGSGVVTGALLAVSGSIIPGGLGAAGTLSFSNSVTESGGINNQIELSSIGGTNDLIKILGDLTATGTNIITASHFGGGQIPIGTYPLITYSGAFNGGLSNFAVNVVGVTGTLTNLPNQIALIISPGLRGATNLTWKGDGAANSWDVGTSNWVNGATAFAFQAGDSVRFDESGAANSMVTLVSAAGLSPSSVVVSNTGSYTFTGDSRITGTTGLTKTNSGTLTILTTNDYTGPTIVGGGVLEVNSLANGNSASSIGASSSDASNLVFYGSIFKYSGSSAGMDRNATLNGTGVTIDIPSGTLTENGSLTGPGALTKFGAGTLTLTVPNTYAGGTIISNGVLALGANNANSDGAGGSALGATNIAVTFYGGTLQLFGYNGSLTPNYSTFYNPLIIPAGQNGTLRMWPRGPANSGANSGLKSSLTGSGTLNLVVNYIRDNLDGDWSAFTGLINVTPKPSGSGDEMRINNNFGYANASIFLNDGVFMDYQLNANATVDIGELGGTSLSSVGVGSLSPANTTWRVGFKNTDHTYNGTISGPVSITKVGTAPWTLSGLNTYIGSTTISNGVLALTNGVNGDGAISGSTNIFINTGAVLDVIGRTDGTMPLNSGQVVCGYGVLRGLLDTTAGGTVSAGGGIVGGIGTLTVTNTVNLGGTAWMKLNRASTPNSDRLVSSTASVINYGGTLAVTNIGAQLHVGDTFTLFSAATRNNSFSTLALPNYYTWNTSQLNASGQISVTGVLPLPAITNVDYSSLSSGSITLNAMNGLPNGGVSVLTSTNVASPRSSWTTVITTTFDGSGNLSQPVTVDPALPASFYLLQAY